MKTMRTTVTFLVAIFISTMAFGTGNLKVNVTPLGEDNAIVNISNTALGNFDIEVRDLYGELIFSKKTKGEAMDYRKKYDFSRLDDGTYDLTVKTETDIYESRFTLEHGDMTVLKESRTAKPYFYVDNNIFKMSYLNFDQNNLKLYVYGENDLLLEKKLSNDFAVHEGLDFSKTGSGMYRIVLVDDNNIFQHYVMID